MAAFDGSELVGVRPALPWRLMWGERERVAYEFAEGMVAPAHRNRGIFTRLVEQICEDAELNDYTLFTSANDNSLPIYRRSTALRVVGVCETRVRPVSWHLYLGHWFGLNGRTGAVLPEPSQNPVSEGDVRLVSVSRFASDFEETHAELARVAASFTLRRTPFLEWRYFGSPVRRYHVALVEHRSRCRGYLVIRMIDRVAHLVDVFLSPDHDLAWKALHLVVARARQMGAIAVQRRALGRPQWRPAARSGRLFLHGGLRLSLTPRDRGLPPATLDDAMTAAG
jgi:GNAT superfamily N-acetyltransferase